MWAGAQHSALSKHPQRRNTAQVLALRPRAVSLGRGAPLASYPTSRAAPVMMMISVGSAYPLLADLPDQSAAVLQSVGVSAAHAFFFICLVILQTAAFFALKKDTAGLKNDLKKDIENLSKTVSMQQQLNTYASSRPPRPWALTSSRSHSLCELSLAHSPTPPSSDHCPLLTFLPRAPKQSGEYARRPLHVDLRDLRGDHGLGGLWLNLPGSCILSRVEVDWSGEWYSGLTTSQRAEGGVLLTRVLYDAAGAHKADRSSAGRRAFFDAAPWVGCLLMMMPRPARRF